MQFPIQPDNETAQTDALNYLLSGPGGLGQDFNGFASFEPYWLTGNYRTPYSQAKFDADGNANPVAKLYVAPIDLSNAELLDPYTFKFTFAATQTPAPFTLGNPITIKDVVSNQEQVSEFSVAGTKAVSTQEVYYYNLTPTTLSGTGSGARLNISLLASASEPYDAVSANYNISVSVEAGGTAYAVGDTVKILGTSLGGTTPANDLTLTVDSVTNNFNGTYIPIGVVECTTDYVICKTNTPYATLTYVSGGKATFYNTAKSTDNIDNYILSTDCNSKIVVTGGNDRVFIGSQLTNKFSYSATVSTDLNYTVAINRYKGFPNTDPVNPGFFFLFDKLIMKRTRNYPGLNGNDTLEVENIFGTLPDADIPPGYYWYIQDVSWQRTNGGDLEVTDSTLTVRSMTTQVVKQ